jgi:flagellar biosynthesis/type III secretory pathway protein FliH
LSTETTPPVVRIAGRVGAIRVGEANIRDRAAEADRARIAAEEAREAEIFLKALEATRSEWCGRFENVIGELSAECERIQKSRDEAITQMEPHVIDLALGISRRLVAREIAEGDLDIRPVVEAVIRELREPGSAPIIEIALHPDDLGHLDSTGGAPEIRGVRVNADAAVARGACVVTTAEGRIWSDLDSRVEAIGRALRPEGEVAP